MAIINTNISAVITQNAMAKNDRAMQTTMERLSTGKSVNSAQDDAAGIAVSSRMTSQIKGLDQASGIAVLTAAALACCCGTSCVGWCWFRRRRDNYAAGKSNTVSAANNNQALPAAQP